MPRKRSENSDGEMRHSVSMGSASRMANAKISVSSRLNLQDAMLRSLSTIHRSTSFLPSSQLDLDLASAAGLHIIRPETHPAAFVPIPPDGGWGWVICFAAFLTNLVIDGICVSFGVMVNDLVESFETSVSKVMLIGSLLVGVYQMVGPIAAGLVNKFGCRAIGVTGALLASVAVLASAFAPTIEVMLVMYGIVAGMSFGFLHLPTIICVSFYFESKRALAIGIAVSGSPIGAMVFAPLTEMLLNKYGWSNTLIFISGILLNCAVLACLYRPLTPAIMLKPMTQEDVDAIAPLLMAEGKGGEEGPAAAADQEVATSTGRDLQHQPLIEEEEEDEEKREKEEVAAAAGGDSPDIGAGEVSQPPGQPETKSVAASDAEKQVEDKARQEDGRGSLPDIHTHHRHSGAGGRRRHKKKKHPAALQQIMDSFSFWRKQVRHKNQQAKNARHQANAAGGEASGDESSSAFDSSCSSASSDEDASGDESSQEGETAGPSRTGRARAASSAAAVPALTTATQETPGVSPSANAPAEPEEDSEARDQLKPLVAARRPGRMRTSTVSAGRPRPPPEIVVVDHDQRKYKKHKKSAPASSECILSTPNLGLGGAETRAEGWLQRKERVARQRVSEMGPAPRLPSRKPSRIRRTTHCADRMPRASVVTMAHLFPMRSVSMCVATPQVIPGQRGSPAVLTPNWTGSQGVHVSTGSGLAEETEKALRDALAGDELSGPYLVELPHESITIEDYARPLYRKDIFFPGSVKCQPESTSSVGSAVMSKSSLATPPASTANAAALVAPGGGGAGESFGGGLDALGAPRHKASSASQFGSSLNFGERIPLPTTLGTAAAASGITVVTKDGQDANWTGSCLMSLTKIPLPDVFEESARGEGGEEDENAALWEKLRQESGLLLSDTPVDGIFHVPRSKFQCCWWCCWRTHYYYSSDEEEEEEAAEDAKGKVALQERRHKKVPHLPARAQLVLKRTCKFMPKSIWDVITTMLDCSLLKSKSLLILCLSSLIAVIGIYVPLFFICDIAGSFDIPKSQSSLLLTCYGATNAFSRLFFAWAAGQPKFNSLLATTFTLVICGLAVCVIPFWGTFYGQLTLLGVFGFCLAPFYSLTSIVLCEILGLEALTNAYGLITLIRGVSSAVGSPLAGTIVESTGTFLVAVVGAGWTIIFGGLLYGVVFLMQRAKEKKLAQDEGLP